MDLANILKKVTHDEKAEEVNLIKKNKYKFLYSLYTNL